MSVLLGKVSERQRFMRFALVGVFGFFVDFGVYNLVLKILPTSTPYTTPVVIAGVISFMAAIASNFIWNRYWTYPDSRTKPIVGQLAQFSIISIMGLGIRVPLLWILEPPLRHLFEVLPLSLEHEMVDILAHNADLIIAVGVVMFWNFFANRYWTYDDVSA
jgi:putative flippase GtrA